MQGFDLDFQAVPVQKHMSISKASSEPILVRLQLYLIVGVTNSNAFQNRTVDFWIPIAVENLISIPFDIIFI